MKCLTICQPYAHLIMLPDDDDRAKRVENRTWDTQYRGPLLIHAGKSRNWLKLDETKTCDVDYHVFVSDMAFGAIVGVAQLVGVFQFEKDWSEVYNREVLVIPDWASCKWPWLMCHEHVEGPFCWVLRECRRFDDPIPYRGAQGLFDVPKEVVAVELGKAATLSAIEQVHRERF